MSPLAAAPLYIQACLDLCQLLPFYQRFSCLTYARTSLDVAVAICFLGSAVSPTPSTFPFVNAPGLRVYPSAVPGQDRVSSYKITAAGALGTRRFTPSCGS